MAVYLDNELRRRWVAAEMRVAYMFASNGYGISIPFAPLPYDLIVDSGHQLYRVQVKSAGIFRQREREKGLGDRDHFYAEVARKDAKPTWGKTNLGKKKAIGVTEFDLLCMCCGDTDIYVIPIELLKSPSNPDVLMRNIHIKPLTADLKRQDSIDAGKRWEPYKNNFKLV